MRRVALISDQHFDRSSRWEETLRIADWIASDIARRDVDVIALGGDLFERRPIPEETKAAAEWIVRLADIAPVVGVYGNHDVPHSLAPMSKLRARNPITIFETPDSIVVEDVAFACLPWPLKAHLHRLMPGAGIEAVNERAADLLRDILRGLGVHIAGHDGPKVLLGHVMLRAARVSTGQPLIGQSFELGTEDLALARADAYLLGHVHCSQDTGIGAAPVIYPGSPRRTSYGETETKGYAIVDVDSGGARWELVPTPCAPMLLITGRMDDTECAESGEDMRALEVSENPADVTGAEIRLRYQTGRDERDAAKAEAEGWRRSWLGRGAADVRLEEVVIATTQARAPEIARAPTLVAKLQAYWAAKGEAIDETRETRLLGYVAELEDQYAA